MTTKTALRTSYTFLHDEVPAIRASLLLLTVLAAAMFNLRVFALLLVGEVVLDYLRYRDARKTVAFSLSQALRHRLVAITLFLSALALSFFLHPTMPLVAATVGLARAELTVLRGILLFAVKLHILHGFIAALLHPKRVSRSKARRTFTHLEQLCFVLLPLAALLLASAAWLLSIDSAIVLRLLIEEGLPWYA